MKIITNKIPRPILSGYELPNYNYDHDRYGHSLVELHNEFDWMSYDEFLDSSFFIYKGNIYCLSEFMRIPDSMFPRFWHGYHSDSFYSGILVRICIDGDSIIIGWYYS